MGRTKSVHSGGVSTKARCPQGQILVYKYIVDSQGSQQPGKSWKTWKMKNAFSRPGKIMELEKKAKIMEKSWNFKISIWKNHGKTF